MLPRHAGRLRRRLTPLLAIVCLFICRPAAAGPISFDDWLEFGFTDVGIPATGCDPNDPGGPFCIPSFGTPTEFLDAPPWTFSAPAGATLSVTDAFQSGDQFEIFDFGSSLGLTSLPVAGGGIDCGDDPVPCLATPGISSGVFALVAGDHSLTIVPTLSGGGGSGFLRVVAEAAAVPEPGTLALLSSALGVAAAYRRRRRT
jgi:hypothetical protein